MTPLRAVERKFRRPPGASPPGRSRLSRPAMRAREFARNCKAETGSIGAPEDKRFEYRVAQVRAQHQAPYRQS